MTNEDADSQEVSLRPLIARLKEIERKREEDARLAKEGQQQSRDGAQPLLPGSAELKLMRSAQLRLNQRTVELAVSTATPENERAADLERSSRVSTVGSARTVAIT